MTKVNYDPTIKEGYINCDCGAKFKFGTYTSHQTSRRHLSYIETGDVNACFPWYGSHTTVDKMDKETHERVKKLRRDISKDKTLFNKLK